MAGRIELLAQSPPMKPTGNAAACHTRPSSALVVNSTNAPHPPPGLSHRTSPANSPNSPSPRPVTIPVPSGEVCPRWNTANLDGAFECPRPAGQHQRVVDGLTGDRVVELDVDGCGPEHPPRAIAQLSDQHRGYWSGRVGSHVDLARSTVTLLEVAVGRLDKPHELLGESGNGGLGIVVSQGARWIRPDDRGRLSIGKGLGRGGRGRLLGGRGGRDRRRCRGGAGGGRCDVVVAASEGDGNRGNHNNAERNGERCLSGPRPHVGSPPRGPFCRQGRKSPSPLSGQRSLLEPTRDRSPSSV